MSVELASLVAFTVVLAGGPGPGLTCEAFKVDPVLLGELLPESAGRTPPFLASIAVCQVRDRHEGAEIEIRSVRYRVFPRGAGRPARTPPLWAALSIRGGCAVPVAGKDPLVSIPAALLCEAFAGGEMSGLWKKRTERLKQKDGNVMLLPGNRFAFFLRIARPNHATFLDVRAIKGRCRPGAARDVAALSTGRRADRRRLRGHRIRFSGQFALPSPDEAVSDGRDVRKAMGVNPRPAPRNAKPVEVGIPRFP